MIWLRPRRHRTALKVWWELVSSGGHRVGTVIELAVGIALAAACVAATKQLTGPHPTGWMSDDLVIGSLFAVGWGHHRGDALRDDSHPYSLAHVARLGPTSRSK